MTRLFLSFVIGFILILALYQSTLGTTCNVTPAA